MLEESHYGMRNTSSVIFSHGITSRHKWDIKCGRFLNEMVQQGVNMTDVIEVAEDG